MIKFKEDPEIIKACKENANMDNPPRNPRKLSILKPEKPRAAFADLVDSVEKEKSEDTDSARRVRFSSSNFVKTFTTGTDDNKTIWNNTYEEELEKSEDSLKYSRMQATVVSNSAPQYIKDEIFSIFTTTGQGVFRVSDANCTIIQNRSDSEEFQEAVGCEENQNFDERAILTEEIEANMQQVETSKVSESNTTIFSHINETSKIALLNRKDLSNIPKKSILFPKGNSDNNENKFETVDRSKFSGKGDGYKSIFSEIREKCNNPIFEPTTSSKPKNKNVALQKTIIFNQGDDECNMDLDLSLNNNNLIASETESRVSKNIIHDADESATQELELTCREPSNEDEINTSCCMEFTCQVPSNILAQNTESHNKTQKMDLTCQGPSKILVHNMESHNKSQEMDFTCKVPENMEMPNTSRMDFTCQVPSKILVRNMELHNTSHKMDLTCKVPENMKLHNASRMELTCQVPSKILARNMESHNKSQEMGFTCKITENMELHNTSQMDFTCQVPSNILVRNTSQKMDLTCKASENTELHNTSRMDLTCKVSSDIFPQNMESRNTSQKMDLTCQVSKNTEPHNRTKKMDLTSQAFKNMDPHNKTQKMDLTCQVPSKILARNMESHNKSQEMDFTCKALERTELHNASQKISLTCQASKNMDPHNKTQKMDLTCQVPDHNLAQEMELTCRGPSINLTQSKESNKPTQEMEPTCKVPSVQTTANQVHPKSTGAIKKILYYDPADSPSYNRPGLRIVCKNAKRNLGKYQSSSHSNFTRKCEKGCPMHEKSPYVPKQHRAIQNEQNISLIPEIIILEGKDQTMHTEIDPVQFAHSLELKPAKNSKKLDFKNNIVEDIPDESFGLLHLSECEVSGLKESSYNIEDSAFYQNFPSILSSEVKKSDFSKIASGECQESAFINPNIMILSSSGSSFDFDSSGLNILNNSKDTSFKMQELSTNKKAPTCAQIDLCETSLKMQELKSNNKSATCTHIDLRVTETVINEVTIKDNKDKPKVDFYSEKYLEEFDSLDMATIYEHNDMILDMFKDYKFDRSTAEFVSNVPEYISAVNTYYKQAADMKENPRNYINVAEMTIHERVMNHVKLDKTTINQITCKENTFKVTFFKSSLQVTAVVDGNGEVIGNITVKSLNKDVLSYRLGLKMFLLKLFEEKLKRKRLTSSIGKNYSIFTLLDYLSLHSQEIALVGRDLLKLAWRYGIKMDDLMFECTFVYFKMRISFCLKIDVSDVCKISDESLIIADKFGNFSDFQIRKISKLCPNGVQYIFDLIKKVDEHFLSKV